MLDTRHIFLTDTFLELQLLFKKPLRAFLNDA